MFKKFFNFGTSLYKKRESIMDSKEEAFFLEFQRQLPSGFYIFPKMRIADIIETISGSGYYRLRNKILPKHIDFLITNVRFQPILAIELNGASHLRKDREEIDNQKKEIFDSINLPLEFIEVGTNFYSDINNLITKFL